MKSSENSISFDYSFFASMAAIGGIISCAAYMFGLGIGLPQFGFYGASGVLFTTGAVLLVLIKRARNNISLIMPTMDSRQKSGVSVALIMTSVAGDVVYANKQARILYEKYALGVPISPLKINISNKNALSGVLETLNVGKTSSVVSEIGDSGKYLKFEIEKIYQNGIFFSWRIFDDIEDESPIGKLGAGVDGQLNLGRFLDQAEIGLFAVDDNEQVIHVNKHFSKMLFGNDKPVPLPFKLTDICENSHKNLNGKVHFINGRERILCHVKRWDDSSENDGSHCYIAQPILDVDKAVNETTRNDNCFWSSPIGIAVVGSDGTIKEKNVVFGNFIAEMELSGAKNIVDLLQKDNAADVFRAIKKVRETGEPSQKIDLSFNVESEKHGQFYITSSGSEDKMDEDVIIYLHDTTEQKNLELQFSQSQKMQAVGQLAGGIAHDFNNLLTAITGFSDLLLVKHGPGDQSFSDIIQIKQNANRAANLVRQLLAFSRQQTLRPKVLIMTDVVAELSNLLRRLIGSNIELKMNHGRNLEPVLVDHGQLEQVIINLCVNARDAMPDGGKLEIKTRNVSIEDSVKIGKRHKIFPKGEYVKLEVRDTGTGIELKHQNKVFEPFFSTKDVGKGTGLGLSTVYGIIKQTNGFVFLDSEIGVGTVFEIYLPRYIRDEAEIEESVKKPEPKEEKPKDLTGSSTILLVEDEDAVRMFASRALKNKGYTVYEADSGISALAILEEADAHIDLLISDVMMPLMDGPTLVRKIRETDKELKVIFISGYAEDALDGNIMDKDFNFLSKPFSLKQLAEQVKEVLDK